MTTAQPPAPGPRLRLYIAASTPNSARAQRNLEAALVALFPPPHGVDLEIIDVFSDARRAMRDGVLVTPTLVGIFAHSRVTIIGDLTDAEPLRDLLARIGPGGRGE